MRHRIGEFVLDVATRQLRQGVREIELSPKAFRLLHVLAESSPRALSKAELQEKVWPDTFVSEANLSVLVSELRRALRDDPRSPALLRTVYGYGYALEDVDADAAGTSTRGASRFLILWERRRRRLPEGETIVGRGHDADVVLDDASVSRHHARIVAWDGVVTIEDLKSKNGTFVADLAVTTPSRLQDGDLLRLGAVSVRFRRLAPTTATRSGTRR